LQHTNQFQVMDNSIFTSYHMASALNLNITWNDQLKRCCRKDVHQLHSLI
jgi:hypothetical protein